MTQAQAPQPELTPEQVEALNQLDDMIATLSKHLRKMKEACQFSLASGKGPLSFAKDKLSEIQALKQALEAKRATPEYDYAKTTLILMERMFDGCKRMIEIQTSYDQKNMALAEQGLEMLQTAGQDPNAWVRLHEGGLLEAYKFALPLEDARYLEARAQTNLYFALHHWMAAVDGIDAIMRATVSDTAVVCQDAKEEAGRARMAQAIQQAMAEDRELAIEMGRLGTELQEAYAYFEWASQTLKGLGTLPAEARREALLDADWKKLNGKAVFLGGLIQRVQAYPVVAQFFPEPEAPELPFEALEWREAPTAPPSRPGGTGRLGTGRLSGQTGPLGTGRLGPSGSGPIK